MKLQNAFGQFTCSKFKYCNILYENLNRVHKLNVFKNSPKENMPALIALRQAYRYIYTYIQCMYKQDLWNRQLTTRSVPLHRESVTNQHSLHFRCSSMCLALAQIWGVRLDSPYDNVSILANTSKFWKSSADMASLLACRAPTKSSWTSYKKFSATLYD